MKQELTRSEYIHIGHVEYYRTTELIQYGGVNRRVTLQICIMDGKYTYAMPLYVQGLKAHAIRKNGTRIVKLFLEKNKGWKPEDYTYVMPPKGEYEDGEGPIAYMADYIQSML